MQQDDHLTQEVIGSPADLFEIRLYGTVALIDITRTKGFQRAVSLKLAQQVALRHRPGTIKLKGPHVALSGLGKDLLKTQRQTSTVLVVSKGIPPMCITDRYTDRTLTSRRIPHRSRLTLGKYALAFRQFRSISFKCLVIRIYYVK